MSTPDSTSPSVEPPSSPDFGPLSAATEADLREIAFRRLKKRQDFHTHVVVYIVVNGFLWAL